MIKRKLRKLQNYKLLVKIKNLEILLLTMKKKYNKFENLKGNYKKVRKKK